MLETEEVFLIDTFGETYSIWIKRFFYQVDKVNIKVIRGYYTKEPSPYTGKTIEEAPIENILFSMTCRPKDLSPIAEKISEICKTKL